MILNFFNFLKRRFLLYYPFPEYRFLFISSLGVLSGHLGVFLLINIGLEITIYCVIFCKNYITDLRKEYREKKSALEFRASHYVYTSRRIVYVSKQLEECRKRNKFLRALLMKKRIKRIK